MGSVVNKVKRWVKPVIQAMQPYHVADASGMVKLDAMENPYTWPEELKQRWLVELKEVDVNRYPDAHAGPLQEKLREVMAIPENMSIVLGNGSDELIQMIAMALAQTDRTYIATDPSFAMYRAITEAVDVKFKGVSLNDDFSLNPDLMLSAIDQHQPAIIFLAYPNNPTGNLFDAKVVENIIQAAPGVVVLDEAYHAFSGRSFMTRLNDFDNLLVMRTLSKSGLAGLRLGLLAGPNEWISELDKIRLPYNINILSQRTAEFILAHHEILDAQIQQICQSRDTLYALLADLNDIQVWSSATNFILFRSTIKPGDDIYHGLKKQGILIKNLHGNHQLLAQCLRVTVGTEDENIKFLDALKNLL